MPFYKSLTMPFYEADGGQAGGSNIDPTPTPTPEPKAENMIPKSRFDEVNAKYKELADTVAKFETAEAARQKQAEEMQRKQAEEQGEFERLYKEALGQVDSYKQYEQRAANLEAVIKTMVDTKLQAVPAELHELIPENLSAEQTLDWLNKAESKGIFGKKEIPEIGKPMNHSVETQKVSPESMSPLEKILAGLGG